MEIPGKRALVTGAGHRIGRAIALELAARGAAVAVHYHTAEAEAREVALRCGDSVILQADLAQPNSLIADATKALGGLDILVNNASVYRKMPVAGIDEAAWDEALCVNLKAPFFLARDAAAAMADQGVIVNLTDAAIDRPYPAYLPYFAAKAGLASMTAGLARALAPRIRVNAVAPGPVLPADDADPEYAARVQDAVPLGPLGGESSVVSAVMFLIGNDFVTGSSIRVDGGRFLR